jgi:hypothetical protein
MNDTFYLQTNNFLHPTKLLDMGPRDQSIICLNKCM